MSYDPIAADLLRENRAIKADLAKVKADRVRDVSECVSLTNRLAQAEKDLADCREALRQISERNCSSSDRCECPIHLARKALGGQWINTAGLPSQWSKDAEIRGDAS